MRQVALGLLERLEIPLVTRQNESACVIFGVDQQRDHLLDSVSGVERPADPLIEVAPLLLENVERDGRK